jgi:3-phenylpropionate/trans-cinnamate dioxygenase ferredoxin subunit
VVELCRLDDLADGEARRFDVDGHAIAVVRIDGDVYAIGDQCSHQDISLSEGEVDPDDRTIECWKHGSTFDLRTGKPETLPATRPVPVYEVSIRDGVVYLEMSERSEPARAAGSGEP